MKPPWIEYPDYLPGCLGWRMGSGEDYIWNWNEYIENMSKKELKEYFIKYPIPEKWKQVLKKYK